jgi:hypothetical protein
LMFWVFCLVQVKGFWQCIFSPYPLFTKSKHNCVVSYKLGNITLDDASFYFQSPCKSWSTTSKTQFVKMILQLVPNCCNFFAYSRSPSFVICGETGNTNVALHLQQKKIIFLLSIVNV